MKPCPLGSIASLLPAVNYANVDKEVQAGRVFGPRTIPDCQLIYVVSGRMELWIGSDFFPILPGECAYYGTKSPHKLAVSTSGTATFISLHFDWHRLSSEPVHPGAKIESFTCSPPYALPMSYTVEVEGCGNVAIPHHFRLVSGERILYQIVQEYKEQEPGYSFALRSLLMQLLAGIVRRQLEVSALHSAKRSMIQPALQMIAEHPEHPWSLLELAQRCGYHHAYFAALFKEAMGVSPKPYMIRKRMQLARKLLLEEEKVEYVASKLGYASVHYFSRHFKSITGMSPSSFRLYGKKDWD